MESGAALVECSYCGVNTFRSNCKKKTIEIAVTTIAIIDCTNHAGSFAGVSSVVATVFS